ncbi:nucleotidyltransferase domain-containing protein [Bacillus sp. ISL-18]|uniref:type VII toxin-antitoxin system MntA family adenylyltransferase antitoxin n=1 Tax=Bacillus sp. ISL-18 TaxID=2819118 RepID=UPI001BEA42E2|nr:nucleotidyltransferase domain-containing protein [Bacillus sp. ISL-18]MBT2655405.1 nucleotidyltransferase domain-containing protein [Bacillus sp. ISL-18]
MSTNLEQIILDVLNENLSPFLIVLFGSRVKGTFHNESDIDIAYLSDNKVLDKYEIFMLSQELAARLGRDVDLIDLNQASTVFQAQIIHTGKVIYCIDDQKRQQFELKTLKMYTKLNEERFPVLKRIDESGSVYEK